MARRRPVADEGGHETNQSGPPPMGQPQEEVRELGLDHASPEGLCAEIRAAMPPGGSRRLLLRSARKRQSLLPYPQLHPHAARSSPLASDVTRSRRLRRRALQAQAQHGAVDDDDHHSDGATKARGPAIHRRPPPSWRRRRAAWARRNGRCFKPRWRGGGWAQQRDAGEHCDGAGGRGACRAEP